MGVATSVSKESGPVLEIYFAEKENREILPDTLSAFSLVLKTPRKKDIPDYKGNQRRPSWGYNFDIEHTNSDYYRKLVKFTTLDRLTSPINFAIKNSGSSVANDVRVEIKIQDPKNIIKAIDEYDMPKVPKPSYSPLHDINYRMQGIGSSHDIKVKRISNYWLIEAGVEKVQPKSTAWIESCLYIGALETVECCFETSIYSDNLPNPTTKKLLIRIESEEKDAPLDVIKELESDRFKNSDEYKKFIEMHAEKFK